MHCKPPPSRRKRKPRQQNAGNNLDMTRSCARCGRAGVHKRSKGLATARGRIFLCSSRQGDGCFQRLPPRLKRGIVTLPDLIADQVKAVRRGVAVTDDDAAEMLGIDVATFRAIMAGRPVEVSTPTDPT